jgi:hypothetical protein
LWRDRVIAEVVREARVTLARAGLVAYAAPL